MSVLTIHVTNVTGLGACHVVLSLLEAIESLETKYHRIDCYVPEEGPVAEYVPKSSKFKILTFKRRLPKALSRVMECLMPWYFFDLGDAVIVLGDVPLRTNKKQLLLVHQAHLQNPNVNKWVSRSVKFRAMRVLTKLNASYVDCVIVQTDAMAFGLKQSYKNWARRDCVKVVGQPSPSWFAPLRRVTSLQNDSRGLRLFYPAEEYPHKNHNVINDLLLTDLNGVIGHMVLTVSEKPFSSRPQWLHCVGRLNHTDCLLEYEKADALFFPSMLESYGLPLVEAMSIGLPVIAADLPYARLLCGDDGIYFDPESSENLIEACKELKSRLLEGWRPDWSSSLRNIPKTWKVVAERFLNELR